MKDIKEKLIRYLPINQRIERIWFLSKTDFKTRYNASFLGLIWALLNPIFRLSIYYVVFTVVFQSREENFILFLFIGLILYLFFTESTSKNMKVFQSKGYLLENIQISKSDIYISGIISAFMGLLFNFLVFLFGNLITTGVVFDIQYLLSPLLLINLAIFAYAVSVLLSVTYAFLRDIGQLWDLIRMALLWLSGIFYLIEMEATWKTTALALLTPLTGIIINMRKIFIYQEPINSFLLFYDFGYSIILLLIAQYVFRLAGPKALEKL